MYSIKKSFLGTFILITIFLANVSSNTLALATGEKTTEQIFPVKRLRNLTASKLVRVT